MTTRTSSLVPWSTKSPAVAARVGSREIPGYSRKSPIPTIPGKFLELPGNFREIFMYYKEEIQHFH